MVQNASDARSSYAVKETLERYPRDRTDEGLLVRRSYGSICGGDFDEDRHWYVRARWTKMSRQILSLSIFRPISLQLCSRAHFISASLSDKTAGSRKKRVANTSIRLWRCRTLAGRELSRLPLGNATTMPEKLRERRRGERSRAAPMRLSKRRFAEIVRSPFRAARPCSAGSNSRRTLAAVHSAACWTSSAGRRARCRSDWRQTFRKVSSRIGSRVLSAYHREPPAV